MGIVGLAGDAGGDRDGGAVVAEVGYREVKKSRCSGQGGLIEFGWRMLLRIMLVVKVIVVAVGFYYLWFYRWGVSMMRRMG